METNNNWGIFLKGLLIGGLAGAAAGILFAPKAGKELRGDLKEKADETRAALEKTIDRAKELRREADRQLAEVRSRFKHIFREGERTPEYRESDAEGEA